jgi:hypothetical protein
VRAENVVRFDLVTESLNVGRDGGASTVPADGAVCAAALAAWMSASYAGPCLDEIGRMEAKINAKLDAKAAAGPPAPASAMAGMSDQPTPRSMATVEERLGEISPQTVHAVEQAMASARAADGAGDNAACEQALADVQRTLGQ